MSDNSFRPNYQEKVFDNDMTDMQSASEYVYDVSRSAKAPEFFERVDVNTFNQRNLQFNTALNLEVPSQQSSLQPSLWQVPECTEKGYWSQQTDVCFFFLFSHFQMH